MSNDFKERAYLALKSEGIDVVGYEPLESKQPKVSSNFRS